MFVSFNQKTQKDFCAKLLTKKHLKTYLEAITAKTISEENIIAIVKESLAKGVKLGTDSYKTKVPKYNYQKFIALFQSIIGKEKIPQPLYFKSLLKKIEKKSIDIAKEDDLNNLYDQLLKQKDFYQGNFVFDVFAKIITKMGSFKALTYENQILGSNNKRPRDDESLSTSPVKKTKINEAVKRNYDEVIQDFYNKIREDLIDQYTKNAENIQNLKDFAKIQGSKLYNIISKHYEKKEKYASQKEMVKNVIDDFYAIVLDNLDKEYQKDSNQYLKLKVLFKTQITTLSGTLVEFFDNKGGILLSSRDDGVASLPTELGKRKNEFPEGQISKKTTATSAGGIGVVEIKLPSIVKNILGHRNSLIQDGHNSFIILLPEISISYLSKTIEWEVNKLLHPELVDKANSLIATISKTDNVDSLKDRRFMIKVHPDKNQGNINAASNTAELNQIRDILNQDITKSFIEKAPALTKIINQGIIGLNIIDEGVEVVRLANNPSYEQASVVSLKILYLVILYAGNSALSYSLSGAKVAYNLYQGDYPSGITNVATSVGFYALEYFTPEASLAINSVIFVTSAISTAANVYDLYNEMTEIKPAGAITTEEHEA